MNYSAERITVRIPTASGEAIEAWVYLPEGSGPHPGVVMAHGIGGIKAGGLSPFAERFRAEGFVASIPGRSLPGALPSPACTSWSSLSPTLDWLQRSPRPRSPMASPRR